MSSYSYDDDGTRRYRNIRTRPGGRGEPDYVREETYIERGKGHGPRTGGSELVYRGQDDSVEDIQRDFPPPGRSDYHRSNYRDDRSEYDYDDRSRRGGGRRYSDDYSRANDRYSDYGAAAAGGAAGYAAGRRSRSRRGGSRRRHNDRDYDSDSSGSRTRSVRSRRTEKPERRKSGIEEALGGLGLGGLAGGLLGGKKSRSRSRSDERSVRSGRSRSRAASRSSRRRHSSSERSSRSRSRGPDSKRKSEKKWGQAAQAALIAGAVEAFRARKEPGAPWTGDKGRRIATAAVGAGGIDGLLDRNPDQKSKRHLAEAVVGGLAANRLANGPRSRSRGRDISGSPDRGSSIRARSRSIIDRFRGRSSSRPGSDRGGGGGGGSGALKGLAAGGALAAVGKKLYDRSRSRKARSRSRASSADSYVPSRNRRRDRHHSPPSDTGQGDRGPNQGAASRDINNNGGGGGRGGNNNRDLVAAGGAGGGAAALARTGQGDGNNDEEAHESSSTTDMEVKRKKMRGKELLTAGLATVATIHAAHGVYSSMEAHEKRHKMVASGEMSPAEAKKKQTKAWVQDAAAVGIAALGIKGAFSEWKEMNEHRTEIHNIEKRKREKRKRKLQLDKQKEEDRQERMLQLMERYGGDPQMAMMQQKSGAMYNMPTPGNGSSRYQPQPDQSGNPYAPNNYDRGAGSGRN